MVEASRTDCVSLQDTMSTVPTTPASWRLPAKLHLSLPEVHSTLAVRSGSFWRKLLAFAGPGFLVAVGYMIPAIGPPTSPVVRDTVTACSS